MSKTYVISANSLQQRVQKMRGVNVSFYVDPVDGLEVISLRDEDICDYHEESSSGANKRKRNLKKFVQEKKKKLIQKINPS